MRTCVRLLAPCDREWAAQENRKLRRLRRQFSDLRDAQIRLDVVVGMSASRRMQMQADTLSRARESLDCARRHAWSEHGPAAAIWQRSSRSLEQLCERTLQWPFAQLRRTHLESAQRLAEQKLRRALKHAGDARSQKIRHRLRQRLRAANSLQLLNAELRAEPACATTAARARLARALGKERDLWLANKALMGECPEAAKLVQSTLQRQRKRNARAIEKLPSTAPARRDA